MRCLLLLLLALAATPAAAQHGRRGQQDEQQQPGAQPQAPRQPTATVMVEPVGMMIAAFDADGDGRVTRAEFDRGLKRSFDAIDTAHAGALGYIAFGDWALRWLGDRNALPSPFEVDRDGNNQISFQELADRFDLYFTRFDTNKDGVIDRSELLTLRGGGGGGERGGGMRGGRRGGWGGRGRQGGGDQSGD